jgi:hypothetical protein
VLLVLPELQPVRQLLLHQHVTQDISYIKLELVCNVLQPTLLPHPNLYINLLVPLMLTQSFVVQDMLLFKLPVPLALPPLLLVLLDAQLLDFILLELLVFLVELEL